MKPATLVLWIPLLALCVAVAVFLVHRTTSTEPVLILPLQSHLPANNPASTEVLRERLQKKLAALESIATSESSESDRFERRIEVLEAAHALLGDSRDQVSDPDLDATGARIVVNLLDDYMAANENQRASALCWEMRWHHAPIGPFVDICSRVLDKRRFGTNGLSGMDLDRTVVIADAPRSLRRLGDQYKSNPYDSDRLMALTLSLLEHDQIETTQQLMDELFQMSPSKATAIETEMARKTGVRHVGYSFYFDENE